jgi:alpha-L-rhamnosidase
MLLEQRNLGGSVPHVVPDVLSQIKSIINSAPFSEDHGSCAWADAAAMIPWTMYEFYGDKVMLERQYENMKLWVNWIKKQDEENCGGKRLWQCGFHFADWLALDNPVQGSSFGGTDPYYVASAYYYFSTMNTMKAAKESCSKSAK